MVCFPCQDRIHPEPESEEQVNIPSYRFCGLVCAIVSITTGVQAAAVYVPPSLNFGDTYRIIFVTSDTRDATSSDIADYNAFVSAAALTDPGLASLGTTWTALASTTAVNVLTNTGLSSSDTTTPFFNTQGNPIATGVTGFPGLYYDINSGHLHPIDDQAGNFDPVFVWTGTDNTGATNGPLGGASVGVGIASSNNNQWTLWNYAVPTGMMPLYGVSGLLTVTPEPSTTAMMSLGAAALLFLSMFRQRRN
jgi:hypothetical protein